MNDNNERDPRFYAIPDTHGHAKGEHKAYADERPLPLTARMLFLWFYHAARRGYPRFLMVADHMNYLTFEDPAAVNLVRRALKLAQAGDLYGAAETANVDVGHAAVVSEGLRRGMRYSIGAEVDNDPRSRPDAQNIVDAMRPDGMIRSVHFVPITHPVHGENWHWPFDNPEFSDLFEVVGTGQLWESYIALLVDAIERLPGHIVGHFFVPAVFGHWPDDEKLSAYEDRVLDAAAARGMAIEFNTRFLYRDHTDEEKQRYLEANKRLLRKAKERGVGISVGSDAHSPKDQGNAFETVLGVLDELEINEIVFPLAGSLRRVALRVVREPEPEPAPEPVKPPPRAEPEPATEEAPKPARKARPASKSAKPAEPPAPEPQPAVTATPDTADTHAVVPPVEEPVAPAAAAVPAVEPVSEMPAESRGEAAGEQAPAVQAPAAAAAPPDPAIPPAVAESPEPAAPAAAPPAPEAAVLPAAAAPAAAAPPAPAQAVKPASRPAPKAPPKPAPPAKVAAKPVAAKPPKPIAKPAAAAKRSAAKPAAKVAASKASAHAKGSAKTSATPKAAKKTTTAKAAAKRPPAAKKAAPARKAAAKKAAPVRTAAKKAPPKKTAGKKSAAARSAPARKAGSAKKPTKKTATKRR